MSSRACASTVGGCWCDWPEWPTVTPPTRCAAVCSSSTPMTCRPSTSRTPTTTTSSKAFGSGPSTGPDVGVVAEVLHTAAGELLAVSRGDRRRSLVPFVGAIVTSVSLDDGTVEIDPPDGLLDLD